jgi:hypothetical protein
MDHLMLARGSRNEFPEALIFEVLHRSEGALQ